MRKFESGATRDDDADKIDYEGLLSPLVLERFGQYMTQHRKQADGKLRDSDNWQKGIPKSAYIKSMFRHFVEIWTIHRGYKNESGLEDALCALFFNVQGYLHEYLKEKLDTPEKGPSCFIDFGEYTVGCAGGRDDEWYILHPEKGFLCADFAFQTDTPHYPSREAAVNHLKKYLIQKGK